MCFLFSVCVRVCVSVKAIKFRIYVIGRIINDCYVVLAAERFTAFDGKTLMIFYFFDLFAFIASSASGREKSG